MADPTMNFDAAPLLLLLRARDHACFAQLVAAHHPTLMTLARSIIGPGLADEVVQEAWVAAYQALPDFAGRSSIKTWLFTIVSNHAKTRLRKEKRTLSLEALEEKIPDFGDRFQPDGHWRELPGQWHSESPEDLLQATELRRCIDRALAELPPMQRAVFTLRDLEQLSLAEICNNLGISDSNARVLLHRARTKLFQVIDTYQETGQC